MSRDVEGVLARVEAATGPDRAIDARLQKALFPDQRVMLDGGKAFGPGPKRPATYGTLADVDLSDWDDAAARPEDKDGIANLFEAPLYTSSVDAALALVERVLPGTWYVMAKGQTRPDEPLFAHQILDVDEDRQLGIGEGPTQPLAILVALLRALAPSSSESET